jgi:two-component system, LytTR family, sensor kinase
MVNRRWLKRGLIFGCWTLLAMIFATQSYLYLSTRGENVTWKSVLAWAFSEWYTWAALSPFILWLARRFRIERRNRIRVLLIHITAGVLFSFYHPLLQATVKYLGLGGDLKPRPFSVILFQLIITKYHINLLIYGVMIGISHGAEFYRRYRERENKVSQLEALLAQAQLSALRMQLNPHFLFNSLNSLAELIERDSHAANKMVARLGDFLRQTLRSPVEQRISLAEEMEFLQNYLAIERIRFEERLTLLMEIAQNTLAARVPSLILQPIVENAIRHGIMQRENGGRIEIRARRDAGALQLQVIDNGPGMTLRHSDKNQDGNGMAIINTRERLRNLYGDFHRFEMANDPGGGLIVTLEIPFEIDGETGNCAYDE